MFSVNEFMVASSAIAETIASSRARSAREIDSIMRSA